jgi:hypothetical protein
MTGSPPSAWRHDANVSTRRVVRPAELRRTCPRCRGGTRKGHRRPGAAHPSAWVASTPPGCTCRALSPRTWPRSRPRTAAAPSSYGSRSPAPGVDPDHAAGERAVHAVVRLQRDQHWTAAEGTVPPLLRRRHSEWTVQPATSPLLATAFSRAFTARRAFIWWLMEYPTIRPDHASLTAHRYSLPSPVRCSVMSVSHSRFEPVAVKSRWTRSSCTGGPGLFPFLAHFFPKADHQPCHGRSATQSARPCAHQRPQLRRPGTGSRTPDRHGERRTARSRGRPRRSRHRSRADEASGSSAGGRA